MWQCCGHCVSSQVIEGLLHFMCRIDESGKKVRYMKKNGEVLPSSLELGMEMKRILKARLEGTEETEGDKPVDAGDGKTIDVEAEQPDS